MFRVMETFSGIGAQAKALSRLNIEYQIIATADWDINAIMAYDIIHHGPQNLERYIEFSKEQLVDSLKGYVLSPDGKVPFAENNLKRINVEILKRLLCAIDRSNNLASITQITWEDIPEDLDLFTYSFPCQDLSLAGVWHGNMTGIDRDVVNRSGMLWEVERILKECVEHGRQTPQFLLMENVNNIMSPRHMGNFQEWIDYLSEIGYYSKIYRLNAKDFGIPQNRKRVYMLSVFIGDDLEKKNILKEYYEAHDLGDSDYVTTTNPNVIKIEDVIKNDYKNNIYQAEAKKSQLNSTPSRIKIIENNDKIYQHEKYVDVIKTITTKQDRNPNSGVIQFDNDVEGKEKWRYLTPRECFIAMGFDEDDFERLVANNISVGKRKKLFSDSKLIKMAGNSIVVNVLEAIFNQVIEIKDILDAYRN